MNGIAARLGHFEGTTIFGTTNLSSAGVQDVDALIQEKGNIVAEEMYRTFNCGIGMVVCVSAADKDKAIQSLTELGETVVTIGTINESSEQEPKVTLKQ